MASNPPEYGERESSGVEKILGATYNPIAAYDEESGHSDDFERVHFGAADSAVGNGLINDC